ncbi:hypothetical protein VI03_31080, partial [Burkholderia vietnamiensis]|uniref:hypothetical protein n=1 Tax=Burkholderia vietnamiensis TaxID=60552 RepID=UPI0006218BF1
LDENVDDSEFRPLEVDTDNDVRLLFVVLRLDDTALDNVLRPDDRLDENVDDSEFRPLEVDTDSDVRLLFVVL